jgi:hypothetical protein
MYKKFKNLILKRNKTIIDNDKVSDLSLSHISIFYTEEFFVTKKVFCATDDDQNKYVIHCYKNNIVIFDDNENQIAKIYVPKKVKYIIEKDIKKSGYFDLTYRRHLYKEYDASHHIFIQMNYIPEDCDDRVELIRKKSERYSTGYNNPPIIIIFYNEQLHRLNYSIVKDCVIVESGEIDAEAPDIY